MGRTPSIQRGSDAFELHFKTLYGSRWTALRAALEAPPVPEDHLEGLLKPYFLDQASVVAAKALQVRPGDHVLDLCAAPGGKTLVLALALCGNGRLVSNDRSAARRQRLLKVVNEHLPAELKSIVKITGYDGTRWGLFEKNVYNKILIDAPCSSERHLLHHSQYLKDWSPHRTKTLAQQGLALLCAGLEALRPEGRLVYSTCSISPHENQGLIDRFLKKRPGQWRLIETNEIFPDQHQGRGPLFWTVLEKLPEEL